MGEWKDSSYPSITKKGVGALVIGADEGGYDYHLAELKVNEGKVKVNATLTVDKAEIAKGEGKVTITAKTPTQARVASYGLVPSSGTEITPGAKLGNVDLNESMISGTSTDASSISDADLSFDSVSLEMKDVTVNNTSVNVGNNSTLTMNNVNFTNGSGINIAKGSELVIGDEGISIDMGDTVDFQINGNTATLDLGGCLGGAGSVSGAGSIALVGDGLAKALAGLSAKNIAAVTFTVAALTNGTPIVLHFKGNGGDDDKDEEIEVSPGNPTPWPPSPPQPPNPDDKDRVPEPATGVLSIMALAALAARRRRKYSAV